MHAAICFLLTYFNIFGVKMFLTRVDSVIRYLVSEILVHHSGFRDLWQPCFSPFTVAFVACNGQLKNTNSLRSPARTATKDRAIAAWHCLLKSRLVKLESNTLNDKNLRKISLVLSLLARSFRSQLNQCALSDPRDQVKTITKTYPFEVCRIS